ncbi:MAG TPA: glutaminyl-peptide cyclotransferase [Pyrinomonadaceae bacterium]|nr:glutaminyl-peptide cyclotransferase [Pyrinomonadaceae bacterium]
MPSSSNISVHRAARTFALALALAAVGFSCGDAPAGPNAPGQTNASNGRSAANQMSGSNSQAPVPVYGYEVVNTWPHDTDAYTQGLVYDSGTLLESTGQYGASSLRRVELRTGKVLKRVEVPRQFFGEGMTLLGGKIYQVTWTTRKGFVYDPQSFAKLDEFAYDGEGWGLTHDGRHLILSDGTDQLRFLDPETFRAVRTVSVTEGGRPVRELNELEYVRGEVYANVWHTDRIARIDPQTGRVVGWIELKGLIPDSERPDAEAVLNGIAYDEAGDRLFVTGKLWPKLFEVRIKPRG